MASVDPNSTYTREVGGVEFTIKELKASGVRDIANTLKAMVEKTSIVEQLDLISNSALKYVVGWNAAEELSQSTLEDKLDVREIVELLKVILAGSRLSDEDRKKLESPHLSSGASSAETAELIAEKKAT